jgi:MoaA/NifB/PqqE/SkfB family radical SAM enzyme
MEIKMFITEKKLEDVGFYTLSNKRAENVSINSPLWRCEMILLDACNFKCPYCRGLREDCSGLVPFRDASNCLSLWIKEGLKNVRFTGGEPTLYRSLIRLVKQAKEGGVERIAISTNGFSDSDIYIELIEAGVNDISISLDACCALIGEKMSGGINGSWNKVVDNISLLSKLTYVTVGMVFNESNVCDCVESVLFADSLGVSDIRVIPSAQYNEALLYPILKYRIENLKNDIHVRGLSENDSHTCWLAMDDMAVAGGDKGLKHFPCIIHLREGGNPIGYVGPNMRQDREDWLLEHDPFTDPICLANCLDVCTHYNRVADSAKKGFLSIDGDASVSYSE